MARYIPLFPLNLVAYPGEKLNLHIFEPRYKQLVLECEEAGKTFGIPTYIDQSVGTFGTEMEILDIEKKYENGEMDIRTKGVHVFKIIHFDKMAPGRLYAGGEVEEMPSILNEDIVVKTKITEALRVLYDSLGLTRLFDDLPANYISFDIAHNLGLTLEQEYALLQLQHEGARQEMILEHLERIMPVLQETERLKERVRQNGHFKNLQPPSF
ncbi:LON peptidase substrate-binding domain-containing protein [Pontibacter sp. CAU 1760]